MNVLKSHLFGLGVVKRRLASIWAMTRGTRYDRIAGRVAGTIGFVAGIAPLAHVIPGPAGALVAGVCAVAAMLAPRALKAAGLLQAAYNQQMPLIPALGLMLRTLLKAPQIIAEAKIKAQAAEAQEAKDQAERDKAALVSQTTAEVTGKLLDLIKSGAFTQEMMSQDIPAFLKAATEQKAAVEKPQTPGAETKQEASGLTSTVTVSDKSL